MRKIYTNVLVILVICFSSVGSLFGQDISVLENKNGFKFIKLNSDKLIYASNLSFVKSTAEINTYSYNKYDADLFDLFGHRINSIQLQFDNKSNKLKRIILDISEEFGVNYLTVLGYNLKKLYFEFEAIIGPTTQPNKPSIDCRNLNKSCLFFEDRVFDGKIIWESESVVLTVTHKTEHDIKDDGRVGLLVVKKVIFSEKEYELKERIGKF